MTVLVTGGAGYIGSHMVLELADAGERVIVLDNLTTGHEWAIPAGVPLVVGDSGDQELVGRLLRDEAVDAIIHFAASIVVPDSVRDPLGYYRNNTMNTRALIECAVAAGVRNFIFSSTAAVYGNPAEIPVTEDTALAPISPYGWSKLMSEVMLGDTSHAHGLNHVILHYFNVAGPDPLGRTGQSTKAATHLIKVAVEAALGLRAKLDFFGDDYPTPDGSCIRDYIHVSDLARAHSDALRHAGAAARRRAAARLAAAGTRSTGKRNRRLAHPPRPDARPTDRGAGAGRGRPLEALDHRRLWRARASPER